MGYGLDAQATSARNCHRNRIRACASDGPRFNLARRTGWRLLSLRLMRFDFGKLASILGVWAVVLVCSCEKHHVGEMPEAQNEHVEGAAEQDAGMGQAGEKSEAATPRGKATPTPTAAEFFPAKP